jgi:ankyrin repeat protein
MAPAAARLGGLAWALLVCLLATPAAGAETGMREQLVAAARRGDVESLRRLVPGQVSPNVRDENGWTPLLGAVYGGHRAAASYLIGQRADVNFAAENGYTPLMAAALAGHAELVEVLLRQGAKVDLQSDDGSTALVNAVRNASPGAVSMLLRHGADPRLRTKKGTPLSWAWDAGIAAQLTEAKGAVEPGDELRVRALLGDAQGVAALIQRRVELDRRGRTGDTALLVAAREGHAGIVRLLVAAGADPRLTTHPPGRGTVLVVTPKVLAETMLIALRGRQLTTDVEKRRVARRGAPGVRGDRQSARSRAAPARAPLGACRSKGESDDPPCRPPHLPAKNESAPRRSVLADSSSWAGCPTFPGRQGFSDRLLIWSDLSSRFGFAVIHARS